jgi:hypothetical protein
MHLILDEVMVAAGKLRSFLDREERFHAFLAKQLGLRVMALVRSLGNPMRFARGGHLENVQSAYALLASPEFEDFQATNPLAGIGTPVRPLELYELIADAGEAAALTPSMHMLAIEWTLDGRPGVAAAFEHSRRALFELRQKHQGFVGSSLYRFLGTPNRYLVVHTSTSREAVVSGLTAPEVQAFQAGHPPSTYTSTALTINEGEVVKVTHAG